MTASTAVLTRGALALPPALGAWREAAARLPLGRNEKVFFEISPPALRARDPCHAESRATRAPGPITSARAPAGDRGLLRRAGAGSSKSGSRRGLRPRAEELVALFGVRGPGPLAAARATAWRPETGSAAATATPCQVPRRARRPRRPFEGRVFFAGEATHPDDYSTVHGAYASGVRAANEVIAALLGRLKKSGGRGGLEVAPTCGGSSSLDHGFRKPCYPQGAGRPTGALRAGQTPSADGAADGRHLIHLHGHGHQRGGYAAGPPRPRRP